MRITEIKNLQAEDNLTEHDRLIAQQTENSLRERLAKLKEPTMEKPFENWDTEEGTGVDTVIGTFQKFFVGYVRPQY